jgi:pyridoxine 5-phosphate synthase
MIKLNVNIDHVATLRQSRLGSYPDPLEAAKIVRESGANGVVMHLREDRRHVQDDDLVRFKKHPLLKKFHLNLEMAPTKEMFLIANEIKPNVITLVPEKRKELTTEGGLNIKKNSRILKSRLKNLNPSIKVMLFIDPVKTQIDASINLGLKSLGFGLIHGVELNTGKYAEIKYRQNRKREIKKLKLAAEYAYTKGLYVAAGHGLSTHNLIWLTSIPQIMEYNIGHSIIGDSVFFGLKESIKRIQDIIRR